MKKQFLLLIGLMFNLSMYAQDDFQRKGKILIETGYNILGGLSNGTGLSYLTDGDDKISSLGFDGGYFVGEDLALKFRMGNLNFSSGESANSISIGAKYYIADRVPVDLGFGSLDLGDSSSSFLGYGQIGFAQKLASNIYLEPALNFTVLDSESLIGFKIGFALMI